MALSRQIFSSFAHRLYSSVQKNYVKIVEVGPRDGLQNEKQFVPTEIKYDLIKNLVLSGLPVIEVTSFVSPKWIPQMRDSKELMTLLNSEAFKDFLKSRQLKCQFPVLTPNIQGLENAIELKAKEIAVFAAASETFSQKNINCSISESLKRFEKVVMQAQKNNIAVRGYISCVVGCPYEGKIDPVVVKELSQAMYDMGCYELSLGDTIGVGTPGSIETVLNSVSKSVKMEHLAIHCHDTYGQALANIVRSVQLGVRVVDSSIAGLGGCPYAKGATGNVSTEDVVYMLHGMGFETGINLDQLCLSGRSISGHLQRINGSRVSTALAAKK